MTQNAEGKVTVVSSGKVLETKLKRPGNQIGGGERGEREDGSVGTGKEGEQLPSLGICICYHNAYLVGLEGDFIFSYSCFSKFSKFSSLACIFLDDK